MEKKMNILFIVDEFPSISTPFILNQIIGILKNKHNLTILARHKGDMQIVHREIKDYNLLSKTTFFPPIKEESKFLRLGFFLKHIRFLFKKDAIKYWRSLNFLKHGRYALSLRLFYETSGFLLLPIKNFDIIHAQFGPLGVLAIRQRKNKTVTGKIITQFRGYDISKIFSFEPENYYNQLFKEGDWFLANCLFFAQKAIDKGAPKEKTSIQYSGIQTDKFTNPKSVFSIKEVLSIVTVNRLTSKKGVKYILKALAILKKKKIINFKYDIIGDGPLKSELLQLIKKLDLESEVSFLGKLNHNYIITQLPKYDLFISHNVTSKDGDQDAPVNTIKEAMLSGLPVISTFHGGIPEMITHKKNGYLVEEKNVEQLYEAILYVINNPETVNNWVPNAIESTKELFDNTLLNKQLISTYKKVLESKQL